MAFWWVNHKQTREHEVLGGYLWSPKRKANDAYNQTYENMRRVQPGDTVFSYAHGQIGAIGTILQAAASCPKPTAFGRVGDYWSDDGWLVDVCFVPAPMPLQPKRYLDAIGPMLPSRHSPLQTNGNGNQGCYLASISNALGHTLMALLQADGIREPGIAERDPNPDPGMLDDIHRIEIDSTIPETQRLQLAQARIGQGLFRKRVILLDRACRVTGVTDTRVLIASHIKPWREASNDERISGYNGILLSPHVDALFDEQLITFENDGRMLVHPSLPLDVLERWSIDPHQSTEAFRPEQEVFLNHHRGLFARKVR